MSQGARLWQVILAESNYSAAVSVFTFENLGNMRNKAQRNSDHQTGISVARTLACSTVSGLKSMPSEVGTTQFAPANHFLRLRSSIHAEKEILEAPSNPLHLLTAAWDANQG